MTTTARVPQPKFFYEDDLTTRWEARRYDQTWNGWATPLVTMEVAIAVLINTVQHPETRFTNFTIHGHLSPTANAITLNDDEGNTTTVTPDNNWLYDIAGFGLIFLTEDHLDETPEPS